MSFGMSQFEEDSTAWDSMFQRYQEEQNAHRRKEFLIALTFIRNKETLQRLLDDLNPWLDLQDQPARSSQKHRISKQDKILFLKYLSRNAVDGASRVWMFLRDNWANMVASYGLYSTQLGEITREVVQNYANNRARLEEVKIFFTDNPLNNGAGDRARGLALESIENRIQWLLKYPASIAEALVAEKLSTKGKLDE